MQLWQVEHFYLHKKVPVVAFFRSDFLQNPYFNKEMGQLVLLDFALNIRNKRPIKFCSFITVALQTYLYSDAPVTYYKNWTKMLTS